MATRNPKLVETHNSLVKMYKGMKARGEKNLAAKVGENLITLRREMGLKVQTKKTTGK